jgi:tRNA pseudouridine38-40 synthase
MPKTRRQTLKKISRGRFFKLTVAYDGAAYAGWQLQPHGVTVQQRLEEALAKIAGRCVRVHGSGRTDAGVHARAQVAHCAFATAHSTAVLRRALNAHLPEDIRVTRVDEAGRKFHARFSAKAKEYRYRIDCAAVADPFTRAYAWHHPQPLNLAAMRKAARLLRGRHDFAALSANPMREVQTTVRTISRLTVRRDGQWVTIAVRADGFLYKMVRTIVGALVKIGEGKMTAAQLRELVRGRRRVARIETAPAHGLFLWRVYY